MDEQTEKQTDRQTDRRRKRERERERERETVGMCWMRACHWEGDSRPLSGG